MRTQKAVLVWTIFFIKLHLYKQVYFLHIDISEVERIGKDVVMVYFKVLPKHSFGVAEGTDKNSVRIVCDTAEIQIRTSACTEQILINSWL
jgi:hypothetical protein